MTQMSQGLRFVSLAATKRLYAVVDGVFFRYPLMGGSAFASFKGIVADIMVQTQLEHRDRSSIDWKRTTFFGLFGEVASFLSDFSSDSPNISIDDEYVMKDSFIVEWSNMRYIPKYIHFCFL